MPCAIKEQLWRLFIWEATLRFKKQHTATNSSAFPPQQKASVQHRPLDQSLFYLVSQKNLDSESHSQAGSSSPAFLHSMFKFSSI